VPAKAAADEPAKDLLVQLLKIPAVQCALEDVPSFKDLAVKYLEPKPDEQRDLDHEALYKVFRNAKNTADTKQAHREKKVREKAKAQEALDAATAAETELAAELVKARAAEKTAEQAWQAKRRGEPVSTADVDQEIKELELRAEALQKKKSEILKNAAKDEERRGADEQEGSDNKKAKKTEDASANGESSMQEG